MSPVALLALLAAAGVAGRRGRREPWTNGSWFNMGLLEFEKWSNQPDLFSEKSRMCAKLRGLTPGQRRVCRRHKDHMAAVSAGVQTGIQECQYQFKLRRWNCTVTGDETVFGPLTLIASRETAFTHAITSAGVSIAVSRACRDGRLASCGCSRAARPRSLHRDWVWAGCGDDLHYGYKFTEGFVDIRERERKVKRGSREQGRQLMNRHNNEAGRRDNRLWGADRDPEA
ncbi:protein Wnt-5b-like [Choristoneura fumiferana]|uniref:protein Wnt-5b-like n=1 Tax=Choristoneura fumiferana TaxID=7141 RepID=UPI003D15C294